MATLFSIFVDTLSYGMVLFIISIGLSITLGLMKVVNLAHGGFAMIGGYLASYAMQSLGLPYIAAVPLAVLGTVVLALPLEAVLYKPLYGKHDYLVQVLITIGIAFCMIGLANYAFGTTIRSIPLPALLSGPVDIGWRSIPAHRIFVMLSGVVVAGLLWWLIEKTAFGVKLRASVDNANMAASLGIRTRAIYAVAFALSVALGAFGGIIGAELLPIEPHYALRYMVVILVVVSIGGAGSIGGAVVASLLLGFIDTASKYLLAGYSDILFYVAVIAIVLAFPHGLLGRKTATSSAAPTAVDTVDAPRRRYGTLAALGVGLVGIALYATLPEYSGYFASVVSVALLVISLDLLVGYCGVATLGQATFYGVGAYAAGIVSLKAGITDPLAMLGVGLVAGGLIGALSGALIVRAGGLAQLVLTVAIVQLAMAAANKFSGITGGSDGLAGITPSALFGRIEFDFQGETGFLLGLGVLTGVMLLLNVIGHSPFALLCRGIKSDPVRVSALGARIRPALVRMFAVSGMVAGLGGALAALTAGVVGLDSISFDRSAEAFVMLIVGGAGTLFGALSGAVGYAAAHHLLSAIDPAHWLIAIGAILVAVMFFVPAGLQGIARAVALRVARS